MKDKIPQRELPTATSEEIDTARQLVRDCLGEGYNIDYGCLPRNVGVQGDEGVRGDTTMITSELNSRAKRFSDVYDVLGQVATDVCNRTPTTKVLIDITPKHAIPTLISEQTKANDQPFVEKVKARIEGYPNLKRRFYERLDADPMLQVAVWAILDVVDSKFKAKMARKFAEEEFGI